MDRDVPGDGNELSPSNDVAPEYNLRLLWTLSRYLIDKRGPQVLEEVAREAGLTASAFESQTRWVSWEQFEKVLSAARARFASDDEFVEACRHRVAEVYGAFRFIAWATSPALVFRGSEKASKFCSSIGRFEVVETGPTRARIRWISPRRESRLMCLSRQAQCCVAPTLWGLPPAEVVEHSCLSRGDASCEYTFRWYSKRRVLPPLLTGMAAFLVARVFPYPLAMPFLAAAFAATSVLLYEYRRSHQLNMNVQSQAADALREVLTEEAEARREIELLNQRQRDWTRLLEENATRRAEHTQRLIESLSTQHEAQAERLRGVSHDLKGPLSVVLAGVHYLRELGVDQDVLKELEIATYRMNDLATSLIASATATSNISQFNPTQIRTDELAASFGRRLRALALGRDIRVSAFQTRECPAHVEIDPIVLDRIVDNLITNAIKYTSHGSIVCELDGVPGYLVIKLSDTGRGIAEQDIERTFRAGGSTVGERAANSHGLGLSVVLQLLTEIGGRMEVMSKVASGTTFWVHLPITAVAPAPSVREPLPLNEVPSQKLAQVLTIRRRAS